MGLMENLFTREKHSEYKTKELSELSTITMGHSPKSKFYNSIGEGLPLIQGNADIKNRKTKPRNYTTDITQKCFTQDIILSVRAPVGNVSESLHEACIGRGVCAIRSNETSDNKYLYYFLLFHENKWRRLSQGSTFESINSKDIRSLPVLYFHLKEQKRIATILSTADREIELLKELVEELKEEKKGLMQLLLTGIIRVKGEDDE